MPLVFLLVAFLLLGAQPAAAARVSQTFSPGDSKTVGDETTVTFEAAPGEANTLRITVEPGAVRFRDVVPLEAGSGCESSSAGEVVCRPSASYFGDRRIRADLGDGDDQAVSDGAARLQGGPGTDRLTGSPAADTLVGGPGTDVLTAGAGNDVLLADPPISRGSAQPDRLDGGPGTDLVRPSDRRQPVLADLRSQELAQGGMFAARLIGLEGLEGGDRPDELRGDDGPNRLSGGKGGDRLVGFGGSDVLLGGDGDNRLSGGAGDDVLAPAEEDYPYAGTPVGQDHHRCGPGIDRIQTLELEDRVEPGCEIVSTALDPPVRLDLPLRRLGDPILLTPAERCARRCAVFEVHAGPDGEGVRLGRVRAEGRGRRALRLSRRGQALLARRRVLAVMVSQRPADGLTLRFRTTLRAP